MNLVTGEELTGFERGVTAVAMVIPILPASVLRRGVNLIGLGGKGDDVVSAAGDVVKAKNQKKAMASNTGDTTPNEPTPRTGKPSKEELEDLKDGLHDEAVLDELADLRRNGQISDKDLKKAGYDKDEIDAINKKAKDRTARADESRSDRNPLINRTDKSTKAVENAEEKLKRALADGDQEAIDAARKELDDAVEQSEGIDARKRQTDVERRKQLREDDD